MLTARPATYDLPAGGRRPMSSRRPHPNTPPAGADAGYHRLAARMEEAQAAQTVRFEEMTDRILDSLHELKADVRRVDTAQGDLTNRVSDIEREVLETREAMHVHQRSVTAGRVDSAKVAVTAAAKSPLGVLVLGATGFSALVAAAKNVPSALVWTVETAGRIYAHLKGLGS